MGLWIPLFCAACGAADTTRLDGAGQALGQARVAATLPELPGDCRLKARSGVRAGERLDTALLRTDAALARQHARTDRCASWYDRLRTGLQDAN